MNEVGKAKVTMLSTHPKRTSLGNRAVFINRMEIGRDFLSWHNVHIRDLLMPYRSRAQTCV